MDHTPGLWEVVDSPRIGLEIMAVADKDKPLHERIRICHMPWTDGQNEQVEARLQANARLIAAAPGLLKACETALEVSHDPAVERILTEALACIKGGE